MPLEMYAPKNLKAGYRLPQIHDGRQPHAGTVLQDATTQPSVFGPETTVHLKCGPCARVHDVTLPAFRLVAAQRTI